MILVKWCRGECYHRCLCVMKLGCWLVTWFATEACPLRVCRGVHTIGDRCQHLCYENIFERTTEAERVRKSVLRRFEARRKRAVSDRIWTIWTCFMYSAEKRKSFCKRNARLVTLHKNKTLENLLIITFTSDSAHSELGSTSAKS